ncbi:hypothetical protein OESDEN_25184, partial [Oesophagostomum dentatum]
MTPASTSKTYAVPAATVETNTASVTAGITTKPTTLNLTYVNTISARTHSVLSTKRKCGEKAPERYARSQTKRSGINEETLQA